MTMSNDEYKQLCATGSNEPSKRSGGMIYRKQTPERELIKKAMPQYSKSHIIILRAKTNTLTAIRITPTRLDKYYANNPHS